jgi:uncharacterized membrane protein
VFFGLYGLWINRKKLFHITDVLHLGRLSTNKSMICSIATIALGLAWFVLARTVVSAVNPTAPPHQNWKDFGDPVHDLPGLLFNVLTNPFKTIETIVTPVGQKVIYLFGLFAPLAFLSFLSPPSLIIGAPWFIISFLSNYLPYYAAVGHQYVAFVAPFIFISAIYGVKRLSVIKSHFASSKRLAGVSNKISKIKYRKLMLITCLFFVITFSYITILDIHVSLPVVTEHDKALEVFITLIPSNASVLTQNDLFPHISRRLYVYAPLPNEAESLPANTTSDYIFVDTNSTWYTDSLRNLVHDLTNEGSFGIQYASDGILLLKKDYVGETIDPIGKN